MSPHAHPDFVDTVPYGLPQERAARIAARRVFVECKTVYMDAAAAIEGGLAPRLQRHVRQARELGELLAVQRELMHALPRHAQPLRAALQRQLDQWLRPEALA